MMKMGLSLSEAKHLAVHLSWVRNEPTYLIPPLLNPDWWSVSHRPQYLHNNFNPWDFIATGMKTLSLDKDQKKEVFAAFDAARELDVNPRCYLDESNIAEVRLALKRLSFDDLSKAIVTPELSKRDYEEISALEEMNADDQRWEAGMEKLKAYERSDSAYPSRLSELPTPMGQINEPAQAETYGHAGPPNIWGDYS